MADNWVSTLASEVEFGDILLRSNSSDELVVRKIRVRPHTIRESINVYEFTLRDMKHQTNVLVSCDEDGRQWVLND